MSPTGLIAAVSQVHPHFYVAIRIPRDLQNTTVDFGISFDALLGLDRLTARIDSTFDVPRAHFLLSQLLDRYRNPPGRSGVVEPIEQLFHLSQLKLYLTITSL